MKSSTTASGVDIQSEIEVSRPLDVVAGFAADPDNAPEWYENLESVEWKSEPPLALGTKVAFVARFLGRRLAYTYQVVEYLPHRRLVMRTAQGPFPMETTYTWEESSSGTLMILRNRGVPGGFSRIAAPLMAQAMRRANRNDLLRLKELLESQCFDPARVH